MAISLKGVEIIASIGFKWEIGLFPHSSIRRMACLRAETGRFDAFGQNRVLEQC